MQAVEPRRRDSIRLSGYFSDAPCENGRTRHDHQLLGVTLPTTSVLRFTGEVAEWSNAAVLKTVDR